MNAENLSQTIKDNTKKNDLPESVSQAVIQEVSRITNIDPNKLKIINYSQQLWPDGCLGLSKPGELCTLALVEGWRVVVGNEDKEWIYRTNNGGNYLRLENTNCKEKMMNTTKTKVSEVNKIGITQKSITAYGTVNTEGWKDAELILRPSSGVAGKLEFDFVAQPPDGVVAQVISSIEATYKSEFLNRNNHFIVYASHNEKGIFLE